MRLTHTLDSLALVEFAERYPGWNGYTGDKRTMRAVERAAFLGRINVDWRYRMFSATEQGEPFASGPAFKFVPQFTFPKRVRTPVMLDVHPFTFGGFNPEITIL